MVSVEHDGFHSEKPLFKPESQEEWLLFSQIRETRYFSL